MHDSSGKRRPATRRSKQGGSAGRSDSGSVDAGSHGPVSTKRLVNEKLAATSDPLRLQLISALHRSPASCSELASLLESDPARIRYLLRRMREVGLVEVVGTRERGRARENLYSIRPERFVLSDDEVRTIDPRKAERALVSLVRFMFRETGAILRSAPNPEREDLVRRLPLPLDDQGMDQAAEVHRDVLRRLIEIGERSRARLADSGEEPIETLAMVLFFPLAVGVRNRRSDPVDAR